MTTFRISATSPLLNGFIQILSSPPNMRVAGNAININDTSHSQLYIMQTLTSVYGIWNLDFFRFLYTPFCLQPQTNTLQIMAPASSDASTVPIVNANSYIASWIYSRDTIKMVLTGHVTSDFSLDCTSYSELLHMPLLLSLIRFAAMPMALS